jgi:hypothetical protein
MTSIPRTLDALQDFLDAHGGDPRRWPAGFAEALAPQFETDPDARAMLARAVRLEALIEASLDPAPAFDAKAVIARAERTAQVASLAERRQSLRAISMRGRLRPLLALAASLFLGFLVGASGWMPGGRSMLVLDGAEIVALAAESFSLEEAP